MGMETGPRFLTQCLPVSSLAPFLRIEICFPEADNSRGKEKKRKRKRKRERKRERAREREGGRKEGRETDYLPHWKNRTPSLTYHTN